MGDRLGIPGAVSFFPIFFCNQQRVLLLLLHRRNILQRGRKDSPSQQKKRIWKPTLIITEGSEWPLQWLLIFKTLLYSCHMNMSLSKCHIWREGWLSSEFYSPSSKKQSMKPGRCLWRKLLKIRPDFCSCNMMTKLPPELLFLGHEIKIKAKFQRSQSNNSMNDGGAFPCMNRVLWLESFAYGHTTLNTPDLVRSRKLSGVGPG